MVKYLRDELDWPIESDDFDELTFDYEPEELGLDPKTAVNVKEIKNPQEDPVIHFYEVEKELRQWVR